MEVSTLLIFRKVGDGLLHKRNIQGSFVHFPSISKLLNIREALRKNIVIFLLSKRQKIKMLKLLIFNNKYDPHINQMKIVLVLFLLITVFSMKRLPQYLGRGYNIMVGNPFSNSKDDGFTNKYNPFVLKYDQGKTTSDGNFLIPDNSEPLTLNDCNFNESRTEFASMYEYTKQLKEKVTIGGSASFEFVKAAFTLSREYNEVFQEMKSQQRINYNVFVKCNYLNIGLNLNGDGITLSKDFIDLARNSTLKNDWAEFIDKFGTHFALWTVFGGRYGEVYSLNNERISQIRSNNVNVDVGISASFFYGINASYSQNTYERQYVETSSTIMNRFRYSIGGTIPNDFNVERWHSSVISDPQPLEYKLQLWSQAIWALFPAQYLPHTIIASFQTYLKKICTLTECKEPDDNKTPKYAYYLAEIRGNGCGTADIHCTDSYSTQPFDQAGLWRMIELHTRYGSFFDNLLFVFGNELGERRQVGYNSHDWNYEVVTPTSNIASQYHEWTNPDCHHGAHQLYIGKAIIRYDNGQQSAQFGDGHCGSWGWQWKDSPPAPFRVCGHYGIRGFPYGIPSLCWQDFGLLFCRYQKRQINSWSEVRQVPKTIRTEMSPPTFKSTKKQAENLKSEANLTE